MLSHAVTLQMQCSLYGTLGLWWRRSGPLKLRNTCLKSISQTLKSFFSQSGAMHETVPYIAKVKQKKKERAGVFAPSVVTSSLRVVSAHFHTTSDPSRCITGPRADDVG